MPGDIETSKLLARWVHSHEEDEGDKLVFRTSEFTFPPARGRTVVRLCADGVAEMELAGPDDRTVRPSGSWSLAGRKLTVAAPGFAGEFEIESVDEQSLVLRRQ